MPPEPPQPPAALKDSHRPEIAGVVSALRRWAESDASIQDAGNLALRVIARTDGREVQDREAEILANLFLQHLLFSLLPHLEANVEQLAVEHNGMLGLDALFINYIEDDFGVPADQLTVGFEAGARGAWQGYQMSGRSIFQLQALRSRWNPAGSGAGEDSSLWALMQLIWIFTGRADAARDTAQPGTTAAEAAQAVEGSTEKPRELKIPTIYAGVLQVVRAALWDPSRRVEDRTHEKILRNGEGQVIATLNLKDLLPAIAQMVVEKIHVTESLAAHRLLRWLVARVREQEHADPTGEFRKIEISGGLAGLAQVLGMKGSKAATMVGEILDVMQAVEVELPDGGEGSLLHWTLTLPGRGTPAKVKMTVADPLLPTYESSLKSHGQAQREARRLIPMPPTLPPLVGHRGSHGAQAALQILVLEELRRQAKGLRTDLCVRITRERWLALAETAGVSTEMLPVLIETWVTGTPTASPFLMRHFPQEIDVYALAATFETESEFIKAAGKREMRGIEVQKRSFKRRSGM